VLNKLFTKFSWNWLAATLALMSQLAKRISIFWQARLVAGGTFPKSNFRTEATIS
jgi:hypothetical protein